MISSNISISVKNSNTGNTRHATLQHCCKMSWTAMAGILPTRKKNLATLFDAGQVRMWVVKHATWLFNSFCSNVADLLQTCYQETGPYFPSLYYWHISSLSSWLNTSNRANCPRQNFCFFSKQCLSKKILTKAWFKHCISHVPNLMLTGKNSCY